VDNLNDIPAIRELRKGGDREGFNLARILEVAEPFGDDHEIARYPSCARSVRNRSRICCRPSLLRVTSGRPAERIDSHIVLLLWTRRLLRRKEQVYFAGEKTDRFRGDP
jgi:hypothetical protein